MESRFLDRVPLRPSFPGYQTLHPLSLIAYNNEGVYSQARYQTDLVITYHPHVGADVPGDVIFGFSRDSVAATSSQVAALHPKCTVPVWKSGTIIVPRQLLMTQRWLRLRDPCSYLAWWWNNSNPPGYFTVTCTIKACNPYRNDLVITPEPVTWPITTIRGVPAPSLYKFGFAMCPANAVGGDDLLSRAAFAWPVSGVRENGYLANPDPYSTDPTRPYIQCFDILFPNHQVLMVWIAPGYVFYQSANGVLDTTRQANPTPALFGIPSYIIDNPVGNDKQYALPERNDLGPPYFRAGWSLFDYTDQNVWRDWPDPCPTCILIAYYAVPPGVKIVNDDKASGYPCLELASDSDQVGDIIRVPVLSIPQHGVFSRLAVF